MSLRVGPWHIVEIEGGFEVWHWGHKRPKYRFDRRRPDALDPIHVGWWLRHGADCGHPDPWVFRGRILLPPGAPETYVVFGNPGHALHWDECLLCGARFNARFRSPLEGAVPMRVEENEIATYRRRTLRDEAIAAGLLQEARP